MTGRSPTWFYEAGIGENRAALVHDDVILEAQIERAGILRPGTVDDARLTVILLPGRRGIVRLDGGEEALLEPLPPKLTQGARCRVRITREALPEPGRAKLAKAEMASADLPVAPGPSLRERLPGAVQLDLHRPDRLEAAGWSELLEEAATGEVAFPGGALRISLTPAMTVIDVDGGLPPAELAVAGARAAARAIRRQGIGGSIGIDLPTLSGKAERAAAAAAIDAELPQPFERTAVNGFGFVQIVRRRLRASLPELMLNDPPGAAARALLRRVERSGGVGARTIHCAPAVETVLAAHPDWLARAARAVGAPILLRADAALPIFAGHVSAQYA